MRILASVKIVAGIAVALLVFVAMAWYGGILGARYAPQFSRQNFQRVRVGDSLEQLTNRIGYPLTFTIVASRPAETGYFPLHMSNHEQLVGFSTNEVGLLLLRYSLPSINDHYRAFEVLVANGQVQEKRNYFYVD